MRWSLVFLLTGCVIPTPYRPLDSAGGYSDHKMGPGVYVIQVLGNSHTSMELLQSYSGRRADELCRAERFPRFRLRERQEATTASYIPPAYLTQSAGNTALTRPIGGGYAQMRMVMVTAVCMTDEEFRASWEREEAERATLRERLLQ